MVNQMLYNYDENGLLRREYTAHSGAADVASTPFIGYGYDTARNGGYFINSLRLTSVTYPSGKEIAYSYDNYGRAVSVLEGNVPLAEYEYQGLGSTLRTKYVEPSLTLDYSVSGALDKLGRVASHAWKNSLGAALVNIEHGYDRAGNRLYRSDLVQAANSELYTYDEVNQIKSLNRGALNNDNTAVASVNHSEAWNFDETGNWVQYTKNSTVENRTHNAANEIQSPVTHDANGNMTVMPGMNCKYDALNRLVEVSDTSDNLIARYEYNGINHRIKKIVGSVETKSFFNQRWQELESVTGSELTTYVWGQRYIDDLILREKGAERLYSLADPNWNVVAVVNSSTGSVVEKMKYDAFGKVMWMDDLFATKVNSDYMWNRTFTGQVLDTETDLMLYRNRYYHTGLGRFIQRDPVEYNAGDINLMRYVINRPGQENDPIGNTMGRGEQWFSWKSKATCDSVSLYDDKDDGDSRGAAGGKVLKCWAKSLGGIQLPMGGDPKDTKRNGTDTLNKFTKNQKCCINTLNILDHGGGDRGLQQVGGKDAILDENMAKQICESLCEGATVMLGGCSTGTGEKNAINLLFEHCSKINKIIACPFDNSGFPLGWSCGDCSEKMSHSTSCFHKDKFDIFPDGTRKNKPAWETFPRSQK